MCEILHIRFKARRPARHLLKRFLPQAASLDAKGQAGRSFEVAGLRGVSLTLRRGEHVGLVGINGSGKTTLLRAVSGVLPPHSGQVSSAGEHFRAAQYFRRF